MMPVPRSQAVLAIVVCAGLAACSGKKDTADESGDSTAAVTGDTTVAQVPPAPAESDDEIFRGYLVFLPEGPSFMACGSNEKSWIVDLTSGELFAVYTRQAINPGDPVFVEFRAVLGPPPQVGFGARYANQLTVMQLRRAALEGPGCDEDLRTLEFRARGNDPFWGVDIATTGITFSDFGRSLKLSFPYVGPDVSPGKWRYTATTLDDGEHRITIDIEQDVCNDSMSGAYFTFTAEVDVDGRPYVGCAMQGGRE